MSSGQLWSCSGGALRVWSFVSEQIALLLVAPMVGTQNSGNFPMSVLIAPHNNEISDSAALAAGELVETMGALRGGTSLVTQASEKMDRVYSASQDLGLDTPLKVLLMIFHSPSTFSSEM